MANMLDHLAQEIYEGIVGRSETRLDELTLLNVWKFFIECAMKEPKVDACVLQIKRKGDHFEALQFMLNSRREPITKKGDFAFGRSLQTYSIDDDLLDVMDGLEKRFFQLSALKQNVQG